MRENLDPAQCHSERELLGALKAVMLWDVLAGVSFSQAKAADVAQPRSGLGSPTEASSAGSTPISINMGACAPTTREGTLYGAVYSEG